MSLLSFILVIKKLKVNGILVGILVDTYSGAE